MRTPVPPIARRYGQGMRAIGGRVGAVLAIVGLLALTGCSNENSPTANSAHTGTGTATPAANGVQRIVVDTGPDLRFHPSTLVVHPGKVQIVLSNMRMGNSGGPPHDLKVYGIPGGAYIPNIQEGQSASVTFSVTKPGDYRFVCLIHVQQHQTGTLIVRRGG